MRWIRELDAAGGVANTGDLRRLGLTDVDIRMHIDYGQILRVRRGWYVRPDVESPIVDACRVGGRLTCVSALQVYGVPPAGEGEEGRQRGAGVLHIEVPANSVLRVPAEERDSVCVHWRRRPSAGDRGIVSQAAAQRQAVACDAW